MDYVNILIQIVLYSKMDHVKVVALDIILILKEYVFNYLKIVNSPIFKMKDHVFNVLMVIQQTQMEAVI